MKRFFSFILILTFLFSQNGFSQDLYQLIPKEARSNGKLGVYVKSLSNDRKVFEFNADKLFIPASNQKIITSVAALSLLGADYRFKTEFYSGGGISEHGTLYGGLYIKGYGDPGLNTEALKYIASEFKKRGIREIVGGITVDDSYFTRVPYGKGWKEGWKIDTFCPPISAVSLNHNLYYINVYPSKAGKRAVASLEPGGTNINLINKATTTSKKRTKIFARRLEDGKTASLQGTISTRTPLYKIEIPIENPATYTASVFKKVLEDSGIKVQGLIKTGKVPKSAAGKNQGLIMMGEVPKWATLFHTHFSNPLGVIITEYNKNSVNIIGENLIKTLAAEKRGAPGTWESGAAVITDFLTNEVGIKDQFNVADGSGLSLLNQISPKVMAEVLRYAYKNQIIGFQFLSSLPIAGVDGTLKKRFKSSEAEGRVLAKTGYLNNVRALSGYVFAKNGEVLVFSILANGLGSQTKKFQEDLLSELVDCCGGS